MNIKKLEKKRDTQFSVVTRVHDYVMLFEQESYDISEIEIREERLDKAALAYEELQLQLEEHVEDEETKAREELERTRFEVLFDKTKARIKRLKRLATSSNKLGEPEVRLPKMDLPHFNGEIHNWPNFKDLFEAVVHSNEKIPAIQKLMYLKSSLSGEASITIESIPATGSNYTVAWQALLDRFDNIQVLVNYHLKIICADANIKKKSALDLRKLLSDINQNVRALKALGQPTEYWDTILIHLICRRLDQDLRQEWFVQAREVVASKSVVPKLSQLLSFLEIQCNAMESAKSEEPMFKSKTGVALNPSKYTRITATTTATEKPKSECIICHQQHAEGLYKCAKFKGMSVPERIVAIKSTRVCFNCLNGGHRVSECTYKSFCKKCGQNHNTLIHYEKKGVSANQETNAESTVVQSEQEVTVASVCALNTTSTVLLATALIKVKGADGVWVSCRALLDIASQTHLITKQLVDKLRLSNRPANVKIQGVNDLKANTDLEVSVTVRSRINKFQRTLECLIVPKLVEQLPQVLVDTASWGLPTNLPLADPEFWRPGEVDMLIGAELFMELLLDGQLRLPKNLPILQNSVLGWFVSGRTAINRARDEPSAAVCLLLSRKPSEQNLSNLLEKFWSVEEVISNDAGWSQEARECEELFRTTTRQDENGRFIVRLPLKQDIHLGDSYEYARKRFFALEKRFCRDEVLKQKYLEFMKEYKQMQHMILSKEDSSIQKSDCVSYYLPHHAVYNPMKSDKLRVVFDASAKTSNGVSLNDALRIGPTVQEDLFKIVLRFRTRRVAFVADIIKMYRQILVDPGQTIFQQILWRENENAPLESYRLLTVTYGEASSSYLATRCLSWLADTHNASHPMAAGVLKRDFYMDDVLTGAETIEEAQELKTELIDLLKKGCFELSKWSTNSPELESTIPLNHKKSGSILGTSMDGVRTLGLSWDTSNDALYCWTEMEPNNISGITKRKVCSTIARIYDPLGLFAPAVVRAKIFLQSLWQTKLEWDQALPLVLHENWREIFILLNSLKTKSVPRLVLPICKPKRIDIHGFCDASEVAYGACIYIRSTGDSVSDVSVNLLCSKSRVAPVKQLSIPRLELCGAVLLSRLLAQVTSALDCVINEIFLWSDSMIVLAWLKDTPGRWKTFVANRVSEVQHLCSKGQWGHVRSADNPADLLSRGIKDITELSDLWWRGPAWLSQPPGAWPATGDVPTNVPEARMVNVVAMVPEKWIIENYSSWEKLSNVVSYCMRFIFNCRVSRSERKLSLLNVHERERSQHSILKLVQLCGFPEEHKKLSNAQIVRTGVLSSLDVFLDDNGLIRVGGRLANANLSYAERHPIVLPSSHHVTTLIIRNQHEKQLHANTQAVLSVLRCTYWIIHGRSSVRRVIRACIQCKKCLKETGKQQMGNLPSARVCPARPFETTGVDYGGPFKIRQNLLRRASSTKGYVALFVCLVTKAIHLELVTDLRTASFIAALKRFTSRRGLCKKIYSDNGTTFVGTCHEFERLWASKQHQELIVNYAISNRISFNFIPPLAPHQGGLWEAGIKSVKYHLQRVIGNTELTYEEFSTVLCQVEACLNSRPLVPLSENPEEYDILTPAHFLIGAPLVAPIQEDVPEPPRSRTDRWKLIQHLTQQIWRRWQREYLQHLQVRGKWKCPYPNIKIGTLVLMKDSTAMPASWSLGRVTEVQFGTDGLVRSVRIKTAQGLYTRAIQQVVPLLSEDSVV